MYREFNGKLLLFGEYSLMAGSRALIMPLTRYSGRLALPGRNDPGDPSAIRSNRELRNFLDYLSGLESKEAGPGQGSPGFQDKTGQPPLLPPEGRKMAGEIDRGLYFLSDIPEKYGVGSSAALTASVYEAFARKKINRDTENRKELTELKGIFSRMESYYHSSSSGIDPLCSYTGKSLLFEGTFTRPVAIQALPGNQRLFLLDSGIRGGTGQGVSGFRSKLEKDPHFARIIREDLAGMVEDCIRELLQGAGQAFARHFARISEFQLEKFGDLIPSSIRRIWDQGLRTGTHALKLCGSGGGGFFLGFSDRWNDWLEFSKKDGKVFFTLDL